MQFQLLRTNPLLTTNVKLVVSDGAIYLDSLDSDVSLNEGRYKKVIFSLNNTINENIGKYWKNTNSDIAFKIKDNEDYDTIYNDYSNQIDQTYISGSSTSDNYTEDMEYFAPLYSDGTEKLPTDFIIFRIDGSGVGDTYSDFRNEFINEMKIISSFDLSTSSKIGKALNDYYSLNNIPTSAIDINFNDGEFSYWNGIHLNSGQMSTMPQLLSSEFNREMTFTQGHELMISGFRKLNIIYPFIHNISYSYNDVSAMPWSINRYIGLYGSKEILDSVTGYNPPELKPNVKIDSNNYFTMDGIKIDPFKNGYKSTNSYYIEYNKKHYLVKKDDIGFRIITAGDTMPEFASELNANYNTITNNVILDKDGSNISLNSDSDILFIEIDGKYYRLLKIGDKWTIISDYTLSMHNYLSISFNGETNTIKTNYADANNRPLRFTIYQFNMLDIKDFDTSIIDTDFSKFEYESESEFIQTEEPKLYEDDLSYLGHNKPIEQYTLNNELLSIPVASEYLATGELYDIYQNTNTLNNLWRKNTKILKWGYKNSISNYNYPYLFNLNRKADSYNRTTNTENTIPSRPDRNLDYFYTFSTHSYNFGYDSEVSQSLSITSSGFDTNKYFNEKGYFSTLMEDNIARLNSGDADTPNRTLFKGISINIYAVSNIDVDINSSRINSLSVSGTNDFENYSTAIVYSDLNVDIDNTFTEITNNSKWNKLKKWERNTGYDLGDIVLFDPSKFKDSNGDYGFVGYGTESGNGTITPDAYQYPDGTIEEILFNDGSFTTINSRGPNGGIPQIFKCISKDITTDPNKTLIDSNNWEVFPPSPFRSVFYQNVDYTLWNTSIDYDTTVADKLMYITYYKGEFYKCVRNITTGSGITPDKIIIGDNSLQIEYWEKIVEFSSNTTYTNTTLLTKNGSVYYYDTNTLELKLVFSFEPNGKAYNIYDTVSFNDSFYFDMVGNSVFDNGINIYLDKIEKNILIHLYSNNNIVPTYNINRDSIYVSESQSLVASNTIDNVNTMGSNGISSGVRYYIKDSSGVTKYDISNISNIPYIIQLESPTNVSVYDKSITRNPVNIDGDTLRITKKLVNNNLGDTSQVNYLSDQPVANQVIRESEDMFSYESKTFELYRFNGCYEPIFNKIEIFKYDKQGNYIFNEPSNKFGVIKEIIKSKISTKSDLIDIESSVYTPIFPQIDKFGYFSNQHNIFDSNWSDEYYTQVNKNNKK